MYTLWVGREFISGEDLGKIDRWKTEEEINERKKERKRERQQWRRSKTGITYKRNIEACSCNHCCFEKAISITHSECAYVALGIEHAIRMRHIFICGLSIPPPIIL